jgi:oligopeptidase B
VPGGGTAGEVDPPDVKDGEEVLLDGNVLADGRDFFALGTFDVSPDGNWLAYSTDFDGDERFTLKVKDLRTSEVLADEVPDTFYGSAWSTDASTLFYITVDEAWRPYRIWRHTIGQPAADDALVYEEADERFWVGVELTRSEKFILIEARSKVTSEVRVLAADNATAEPAIIAERRQGVEYSVEHHGHRFLILHNDQAEDFALAYTSADAPGEWIELIPHQPGIRLESVNAFLRHIVISVRRDGLTGCGCWPTARPTRTTWSSRSRCTAWASPESRVRHELGRIGYTSMVTPESVYDVDLVTRSMTLPQAQARARGATTRSSTSSSASGRLRTTAPACRSRWWPAGESSATARRRSVLYGYGSYEYSYDRYFSIARLSLLDRGVVYAIAHVRGGGEMGRQWYESGKLLAKKNTFTDFVACAQALVKDSWTAPDRLVARGGSAGGLLMGAVANLAPDLFAGIVAQVPFVDPLTSILDPSLPLTVGEWEEWGNPLESPEVYAYMKSYSPYENVAKGRYPAILAVTSLNDTRVLYHEPAKWIARLRSLAPEGSYLLKTEMGAGTRRPSGRYDSWKEEAFITAWILDVVGKR